MIRWVVLLLLWALPAAAEQVVLGLSRDQVAITATFEGSEILIFGAVKRESPIQRDPGLEVVIAVSGPELPATVRRKSRVAGIWMNTESIAVDAAPSFYAVATTGPLREVLSWTEDLRHDVSIPRSIRAVDVAQSVADPESFREALVRVQQEAGQYQMLEDRVTLAEHTLFRTSVDLPANLIEGNYRIRILLTREGRVIDRFDSYIVVRKVGIERLAYDLAHQQPFVYGLVALALAIAAGWAASAAAQALRS